MTTGERKEFKGGQRVEERAILEGRIQSGREEGKRKSKSSSQGEAVRKAERQAVRGGERVRG